LATRTEERTFAGRYRVIDRLGAGGMATVFLAEDQRLSRLVAVKRLHGDSAAEEEVRFRREAKVGASLSHPNLVSIFDTRADEDSLLIVMEYVEGETLADALTRGRLSRDRAAEIIRGLAAGLDYAHAQGIVHRDVKPGNVLLGERGAVKLADLGIAKALERTELTRSGTLLGTPAYMAPEQLEGGPLGPATDIYALAAVAFEALSGSKARTGRTAVEIAHRVATEPPPDLQDAWAGAPDAAADAVAWGMEPAPGDRPGTAMALSRALDSGLGVEPTGEPAAVPRTVPAPTPTPRPSVTRTTELAGDRTPPGGIPPILQPASRSRRPISLVGLLAPLAAAALVLGAVVGAGSDSGHKSKGPGGSKSDRFHVPAKPAGGAFPKPPPMPPPRNAAPAPPAAAGVAPPAQQPHVPAEPEKPEEAKGHPKKGPGKKDAEEKGNHGKKDAKGKGKDGRAAFSGRHKSKGCHNRWRAEGGGRRWCPEGRNSGAGGGLWRRNGVEDGGGD
jgi:eukaryotic-like serine/threonine-protein kinase